MAGIVTNPRTGRKQSVQPHLTESPAIRWTLILIALLFIGLIVILPLVSVIAESFRKGWEAYVSALTDPDAMSALRLTLLTAAIAVPLNTIFGVAAA